MSRILTLVLTFSCLFSFANNPPRVQAAKGTKISEILSNQSQLETQLNELSEETGYELGVVVFKDPVANRFSRMSESERIDEFSEKIQEHAMTAFKKMKMGDNGALLCIGTFLVKDGDKHIPYTYQSMAMGTDIHPSIKGKIQGYEELTGFSFENNQQATNQKVVSDLIKEIFGVEREGLQQIKYGPLLFTYDPSTKNEGASSNGWSTYDYAKVTLKFQDTLYFDQAVDLDLDGFAIQLRDPLSNDTKLCRGIKVNYTPASPINMGNFGQFQNTFKSLTVEVDDDEKLTLFSVNGASALNTSNHKLFPFLMIDEANLTGDFIYTLSDDDINLGEFNFLFDGTVNLSLMKEENKLASGSGTFSNSNQVGKFDGTISSSETKDLFQLQDFKGELEDLSIAFSYDFSSREFTFSSSNTKLNFKNGDNIIASVNGAVDNDWNISGDFNTEEGATILIYDLSGLKTYISEVKTNCKYSFQDGFSFNDGSFKIDTKKDDTPLFTSSVTIDDGVMSASDVSLDKTTLFTYGDLGTAIEIRDSELEIDFDDGIKFKSGAGSVHIIKDGNDLVVGSFSARDGKMKGNMKAPSEIILSQNGELTNNLSVLDVDFAFDLANGFQFESGDLQFKVKNKKKDVIVSNASIDGGSISGNLTGSNIQLVETGDVKINLNDLNADYQFSFEEGLKMSSGTFKMKILSDGSELVSSDATYLDGAVKGSLALTQSKELLRTNDMRLNVSSMNLNYKFDLQEGLFIEEGSSMGFKLTDNSDNEIASSTTTYDEGALEGSFTLSQKKLNLFKKGNLSFDLTQANMNYEFSLDQGFVFLYGSTMTVEAFDQTQSLTTVNCTYDEESNGLKGSFDIRKDAGIEMQLNQFNAKLISLFSDFNYSFADGFELVNGTAQIDLVDIKGIDGAIRTELVMSEDQSVSATVEYDSNNPINICGVQVKNPEFNISIDNKWELTKVEGSADVFHPDMLDFDVNRLLIETGSLKEFSGSVEFDYKGFAFEIENFDYDGTTGNEKLKAKRAQIVFDFMKASTTAGKVTITEFSLDNQGEFSISGVNASFNTKGVSLGFSSSFVDTESTSEFRGSLSGEGSILGLGFNGSVVIGSNLQGEKFDYFMSELAIKSNPGVYIPSTPLMINEVGGMFGNNYRYNYAEGSNQGTPENDVMSFGVGLGARVSNLDVISINAAANAVFDNQKAEFSLTAGIKAPQTNPMLELDGGLEFVYPYSSNSSSTLSGNLNGQLNFPGSGTRLWSKGELISANLNTEFNFLEESWDFKTSAETKILKDVISGNMEINASGDYDFGHSNYFMSSHFQASFKGALVARFSFSESYNLQESLELTGSVFLEGGLGSIQNPVTLTLNNGAFSGTFNSNIRGSVDGTARVFNSDWLSGSISTALQADVTAVFRDNVLNASGDSDVSFEVAGISYSENFKFDYDYEYK